MRRWIKWPLIVLAVIVALPVLLVAFVLIAFNTAPGQRFLASKAGSLSGGLVALDGLSGGLPGDPRIHRIEVRDAQGPWLVITDAALDWSPLALIHGTASIRSLTAKSIEVRRLPVAAGPPAKPSAGGESSLPVHVDLAHLHVGRIDISAAVAGHAASVSVDGSAQIASLQDGSADVTVTGLAAPGTLHLVGRIDPETLKIALAHDEPAHGLLAMLGGLPNLGALSLRLNLDGPWTAAGTKLTATAGPISANAHGTLDLRIPAADLTVSVHAPAMTPAPGVSFDAVVLDAHVAGPPTAPTGTGTLRIDALAAGGATVHRLDAELHADKGRAGVTARLDGLRIPGPRPDLFEADPLTLVADATLSDPTLPVSFDLKHMLLDLRGTAAVKPTPSVKAHLIVPDLTPLAAAGSVALSGSTALDIAATQDAAGAFDATLTGMLGVTGGLAPVPGLIGPDGRIDVSAHVAGSDLTLQKLDVHGAALTVAASGGLIGGKLDAIADIGLPDLHILASTVSGNATLHAHATGATDDLALDAYVSGDVATTGVPKGHVAARVRATGLPANPAGHIGADGQLDGAPLTLSADMSHDAGATKLTIDRADWRSAHAEGALSLAAGATLPTGHLVLRMTRLDDLRRITGQAISGAIDAMVDLSATTATAKVRATRAGIPGSSVASATLDARVDDPAHLGRVDATLVVTGISASSITADARATVSGPRTALAIAADVSARQAGQPATLRTRAMLDLPAQTVAISEMVATARGETARLLAPARVKFGTEVSVDRLRVGLRQAVLEIAGRASPTLDLTARLSNVTADLARIADPTLIADGTLSAEARLTGTPARPQGTARIDARGIHLHNGPAAGLPPANLLATATLRGTAAQLDARLAIGRNTLSVAGTAPITPSGPLDLHATGALDLAVLNPILTASGERARGQLALDATITGTLASPSARGNARLSGGEFQDFSQGARISQIEAQVDANGDTINLTNLSARAGTGTIHADGTIGLQGARPVDLHLTMARAQPLSSDLLTATLDADLALRGSLGGRLDATGSITVQRADIRVPDKLPASVAVLDVRRPGQKPPPPAPTW